MPQTFDTMPVGERNRWLAWANSHDWGAGEPCFTRNLQTGKIGLHVECAAKDETGDWYTESFLAMSPRQLRDWAGY